MIYPRYGDSVIVDNEPHTVLGMWPDRKLVKVRRDRDSYTHDVLKSSCEPVADLARTMVAEAFAELIISGTRTEIIDEVVDELKRMIAVEGSEMMSDTTKDFDPAVLASITTGILLVKDGFSAMHEAAEWVLGYPVWTHEFARKELWEKMTAAVVAQFPGMPTAKEDAKIDWQKVANDVRAQFGESVSVRRGTGSREADPLTTLAEVLGPERVVVATT